MVGRGSRPWLQAGRGVVILVLPGGSPCLSACATLVDDPDIVALNHRNQTVNGTVHLFGIAQDEDEPALALDHAHNTEWVKGVVSHAILKDDPSRPAAQ